MRTDSPPLMPHRIVSHRQRCLNGSSKPAFKIGLPSSRPPPCSLRPADNHRSSSDGDGQEEVVKNVLQHLLLFLDDDGNGQGGQRRLRPPLPRRHPRRGMVSYISAWEFLLGKYLIVKIYIRHFMIIKLMESIGTKLRTYCHAT